MIPIVFMRTLYRLLLQLYPVSFRQDYGEEMRLVFDDMCQEAVTSNDPLAGGKLLMRILLDTVTSALREHKNALKNHLGDDLRQPGHTPLAVIMLALLPGLYLFMTFANDGKFQWYRDGIAVLLILVALVMGVVSMRQQGDGWIGGWMLFTLGMLAPIGLFALMQLLSQILTRISPPWFLRINMHSNLIGIVTLIFLVRHILKHHVSGWVLALVALIPAAGLINGLIGSHDMVSAVLGPLFIVPFYLIIITLGLAFTQRHGSGAALFVLGALVIYNGLDVDYALSMMIDSERFIHAFEVSWALGAFVIVPLSFYSAQTEHTRTLAALVPFGLIALWKALVHGISREITYGTPFVTGYLVNWVVTPLVMIGIALLLFRSESRVQTSTTELQPQQDGA